MRDVNAVEEILRRWDPIAGGECKPRDEYDSYAPHIVSLVRDAPDATLLAKHLGSLQLESMGLGETPTRNLEIAREIVNALAQGRRPSPS
jgi:hypothetical protein